MVGSGWLWFSCFCSILPLDLQFHRRALFHFRDALFDISRRGLLAIMTTCEKGDKLDRYSL